jgi:Sulfotransferase family
VTDCIPLIISGAPRSGTSLLYNLFDGHSQITWLVDEGYLFEYLYDLGPAAVQIFVDAAPADVQRFVDGLRDRQVVPPLHQPYRQSKARGSVSEVEIPARWDECAFRAALAKLAARSVPELWLHLVDACLAGMGEQRRPFACLKSPDYAKSVWSATDLIPEARGIVIVRDPLYAIDSLKRSRELRGEKLLSWPQLALNIHAFRQLIERVDGASKDRTMCVRYESLVAQTEKTMRSIADWLKIPFEDCLLKPTMRGWTWPGISSFTPTDGIEIGPSERGIQALTNDEQALVRMHLYDFRKRFAYDG